MDITDSFPVPHKASARLDDFLKPGCFFSTGPKVWIKHEKHGETDWPFLSITYGVSIVMGVANNGWFIVENHETPV